MKKGQKIRIARRENLGGETKQEMGRFTQEGMILNECGDDAYLMKIKNRIIKKCHYDLKEIQCVTKNAYT